MKYLTLAQRCANVKVAGLPPFNFQLTFKNPPFGLGRVPPTSAPDLSFFS